MKKFIIVCTWIFFCFGLESLKANHFKHTIEEANTFISWKKNAAYDFLENAWIKNGFKCLLSSQKELTNPLCVDENFSTAVIMELLLDWILNLKLNKIVYIF